MPTQFAVLASGSRGNSVLVSADGAAGVLIDLGLGPRKLTERLLAVGSRIDRVASVLLTHTHGDHVDGFSLRLLARKRITLACHEDHRRKLRRFDAFHELERKGLVTDYDERPFLASNGARIEPIELRHDGGPTFGFRVESRPTRSRGAGFVVGYVADTGSWRRETAEALTNVDVMGVEFNHDVEMQRRSGRPAVLIARNLGDAGHLSNQQGADLVRLALTESRPGVRRHVVLVHLSEDCNRPELAVTAALAAVRSSGRTASVYAALQEPAHPDLRLIRTRGGRGRRFALASNPSQAAEPWFSGQLAS